MTQTSFGQIYFSSYVLKAKKRIGDFGTALERDGCLLSITTDQGVGFADLHPWPELGDLPLKEQLELLANGKTTPLLKRSLHLAKLDRAARSAEVSAFDKLTIPDSHYLISNFSSLTGSLLHEIQEEDFKTIKVKLSRDLASDAQLFKQLGSDLAKFKVRLDFNAGLSAEQFKAFAKSLPVALSEAIEFVEEPTPWNAEEWFELFLSTHLPLALDHMSEDIAPSVTSPFSWLIFKPAIQDPMQMMKIAEQAGARVAVTSYLDHPVGQMGAALEAALWRQAQPERIGVCGLLSQVAYESNEFSEALLNDGPRLQVPEGTGIGFDDLLMNQYWKKLGT